MKTRLLSLRILFLSYLFIQQVHAQISPAINPWVISAVPDPAHYYGITVANGMIGIVSSPQPFQVKDVVLAGAYDLYGRGRVSNFLRSFNLLNMRFSVDGSEISSKNISSLAPCDRPRAGLPIRRSFLCVRQSSCNYRRSSTEAQRRTGGFSVVD